MNDVLIIVEERDDFEFTEQNYDFSYMLNTYFYDHIINAATTRSIISWNRDGT